MASGSKSWHDARFTYLASLPRMKCVITTAGKRTKLIDLSDDVTQGRVHLFDLAPSDLKKFVDQFDSLYLDRLDPGESESLAFLVLAKEEYLISSADAIVFKVLGNLNRGHQGISVEEVLQQIGQSRSKIPRQYSKQFRESYTKEGEQDSIRGRGKKPKK